MTIKTPPQEVLDYYRERLTVDPEEGILRWKVKPQNQWGELGNLRSDGTAGGSLSGNKHRMLLVELGGKRTGRSTHQVVWYLYYGEWPTSMVDHINRDKLDNRKANLRMVNPQQNAINCSKRKRATSKYKGVSWWTAKGRWKAYIANPARGAGGAAELYLGMYHSEHEAAAAYNCIAREWYGPYAAVNELPPGIVEPERI